MRVAVVDLQVRLGLRALRWAGAFAKPRMAANRILTGSNFSNAHARNMLYGILQEVHRSVLPGQSPPTRGRLGAVRGGSPNCGDQGND